MKKYSIRVGIKKAIAKHPVASWVFLLLGRYILATRSWAFVWESAVLSFMTPSPIFCPNYQENFMYKKILKTLKGRIPSVKEIALGGIKWEPSLAIRLLFSENKHLRDWCFETGVVFDASGSRDFVLLATTNNSVDGLRWAAEKGLSFDIQTKDNDMLLSWVVSHCPPTDPRAQIVFSAANPLQKNPLGRSPLDEIIRSDVWKSYVSKQSLLASLSLGGGVSPAPPRRLL